MVCTPENRVVKSILTASTTTFFVVYDYHPYFNKGFVLEFS